ncbi:fucose isomerase [Telmatobacter bradus]|uniref:fucose isomerase n=1 Tax=Telmatobacter bradus TaxID=474953 RepID=UPI003B42AFEF
MAATYALPQVAAPLSYAANEVFLVASGDLRPSANEVCWPAQEAMEKQLTTAFAAEGIKLRRAHPYDAAGKHGFIQSQRMGMKVFESIPKDAPIVVAESVWQYSAHVLAGLLEHTGPILTVANWSGQWPGLVGMLNLNGCLRKYGVQYTSLWSKDFTDPLFKKGLGEWIKNKKFIHDTSHVHAFDAAKVPAAEKQLGEALAAELKAKKAILAVFDEGCMGMANAIIEDGLMNPAGIFKERLSQSALFAAMREISDAEAQKVRNWLDAAGLKFLTGPNEETDLTDAQILLQCKMYIAALRMADAFGCDCIGIQYQQGLKDLVPASDLVEGLLNNVERPPVFSTDGRELYAGKPLPHFNEVDECVGVDSIVTNRVWTAMGLDPATTLHDVRWGEWYKGAGADGKPIDDFIWLFQISGAVPASHLKGGYKGAVSERQPSMYFRMGGGTLKGVCKPGELVWSRVYVEAGELKVDLGRATVVDLPEAETNRRWAQVTTQWPVQHVRLHGVTQDQFMARHPSNHISVAYAPTAEAADRALAAKATMFHAMGLAVSFCGVKV